MHDGKIKRLVVVQEGAEAGAGAELADQRIFVQLVISQKHSFLQQPQHFGELERDGKPLFPSWEPSGDGKSGAFERETSMFRLHKTYWESKGVDDGPAAARLASRLAGTADEVLSRVVTQSASAFGAEVASTMDQPEVIDGSNSPHATVEGESTLSEATLADFQRDLVDELECFNKLLLTRVVPQFEARGGGIETELKKHVDQLQATLGHLLEPQMRGDLKRILNGPRPNSCGGDAVRDRLLPLERQVALAKLQLAVAQHVLAQTEAEDPDPQAEDSGAAGSGLATRLQSADQGTAIDLTKDEEVVDEEDRDLQATIANSLQTASAAVPGASSDDSGGGGSGSGGVPPWSEATMEAALSRLLDESPDPADALQVALGPIPSLTSVAVPLDSPFLWQLLETLVNKVQSNPAEPKYRRVRLTHPKIGASLAGEAAITAAQLAGFVVDGDYLNMADGTARNSSRLAATMQVTPHLGAQGCLCRLIGPLT